MKQIGKLGLEGLMDRACIIFTNAYQFSGAIELAQIKNSFSLIFSSIDKFKYQINFTSQNNFCWQNNSHYINLFQYQNSQNLSQDFINLSSNSIDLITNSGNAPCLFYVLEDKKNSAFILAMLTNHTYMDARSANYIFGHIIKHYNGSLKKDLKVQRESIQAVSILETIHWKNFVDERLSLSNFNHNDNVTHLSQYKVKDLGGFGIKRSALGQCLTQFKTASNAPLICHIDVNKVIQNCRLRFPQLSRNSIVCAMLAKAFYLINLKNGYREHHEISFKMLSDLLPAALRVKYIGNYIAFVPVSVKGEKTIVDIALDIHLRTIEFKTLGIDVSQFTLTEEAIEQELVGTAEDDISFVVTNWNNYDYLNTENYIDGCQSGAHISGVNIAPKDELGAALVNRPVAVISFSPDDTLCLSFFPSLADKQINIDVLTLFKSLQIMG